MPESPEVVNAAERTVCLLLGFLSVITTQACIQAKDLWQNLENDILISRLQPELLVAEILGKI